MKTVVTLMAVTTVYLSNPPAPRGVAVATEITIDWGADGTDVTAISATEVLMNDGSAVFGFTG